MGDDMVQQSPETSNDTPSENWSNPVSPLPVRPTLNPYRVIHEVKVPIDRKDDAMSWLEAEFGLPALYGKTAREMYNQGKQLAYDPTLLTETNYIWDGCFSIELDCLIFRIKDHDEKVMMFKLIFGG